MTESGRRRRRLRGMMENKNVRKSGWAVLATSVVSAVTYDLKQPNSIIRGLVKAGYEKLTDLSGQRKKLEDISDRVRILKDETQSAIE